MEKELSSVIVSIRIPAELKNQASALAEKESRSLSNLFIVAMKEYIKNHSM